MRTTHVNAALAVLLALTVALSGCTTIIGEWKSKRCGPGECAADFIRNDKYSKLLIEIDYVDGFAPNQHAVDTLKTTVRNVLQKEIADVVMSPQIPGEGKSHKYTLEEIAALEDDHRNHYKQGDTAVLYFIYVDGGFEQDGENKVLGAAYRGSSVVMFKGNIRDSSCTDCGVLSSQPREQYAERAIIVHELGHIIGLVNTGIPQVRPHEDPNHRGHSKYRDSVMYWAVESSAITNIFSGGSDIPYQFDAYDKEDVKAFREAGG